MLKKIIPMLSLLLPVLLFAVKGEVILEKGDYCAIDTGCNYSVIERRSGRLLCEGDEIVGDLESYGFKDVFNLTRRGETCIYVEDYFLDEDDAIEQVYELGG